MQDFRLGVAVERIEEAEGRVAGVRLATGKAGIKYRDRTDVRPGMIVPHEVVVRVFRRIGWGWGGRWTSAKDYQHFSANGR